jgi:hypothetical protein
MKQLIALLFICIYACMAAAQSVTPVKGPGSKFSIQCADLYFEVDSARGARISSFQINGDELMYVDFQKTDMAGSTFWPSPQSVWGWPPAVNLDSRPYLSKMNGDTILFKGATDTKSQLRFYKSMFASLKDTSITIDYFIKNEKSSPQTWAPWEITRVKATGLTIFSKASGSVTGDMASRAKEINGLVWYDQDLYNSPGNKLFCDGQGWLAHVTSDNYLFIKKFENIPANKKAPGEAEIEVYTASDDSYTELENQGAYTSIASKDSIKWKVKWLARALPASVEVSAGSKSLSDYIASILKRSTPTLVTGPTKTFHAVKIYPNPASEKLTVETGIDSYRDVQISIYNLQGQQIFSKTITQQKTPIDVTWLTGGIYFYELKNGKERIAGGKFVVVR